MILLLPTIDIESLTVDSLTGVRVDTNIVNTGVTNVGEAAIVIRKTWTAKGHAAGTKDKVVIHTGKSIIVAEAFVCYDGTNVARRNTQKVKEAAKELVFLFTFFSLDAYRTVSVVLYYQAIIGGDRLKIWWCTHSGDFGWLSIIVPYRRTTIADAIERTVV